jgi:hypothetical protein
MKTERKNIELCTHIKTLSFPGHKKRLLIQTGEMEADRRSIPVKSQFLYMKSTRPCTTQSNFRHVYVTGAGWTRSRRVTSESKQLKVIRLLPPWFDVM